METDGERKGTSQTPVSCLQSKQCHPCHPYAPFSWLNQRDSDLQRRKNTGCHWQQYSQWKRNTGGNLFTNWLCSKCICKSLRRHRNNMICCGEVLTPAHRNLFNPLRACDIAFVVLYKSTQACNCEFRSHLDFKRQKNTLNRTGGGLEMRELDGTADGGLGHKLPIRRTGAGKQGSRGDCLGLSPQRKDQR